MSRPPSVLRDAEFLKLWTGQIISEIGSRITNYGLPMTAVLMLHATPVQMGILASLSGFAALLGGPLAGILADRFRRRPILIFADVARAALLLTVPLAAAGGWLSLPLICAVAAAAGLLTVIFEVAYQSFIPSLVPKEQILEANSRLALSFSIGEMAGPGLTGILVQTMTAPRAIVLDAASFVVSALSILWIRRREPAPTAHIHGSSARDLLAGFRHVARDPLLRPLALRAATIPLFYGFFLTLYMLFALEHLGLGAVALGVVISLGGVSNVFGAIIADRLVPRFQVGHVLIASSILGGLAALLVPAAGGPWYIAFAFLAAQQLLGDISFPVYSIHELTLRQAITPPELLGRVNAVMQFLFKGVFPFGALLGGLMATRIGIRPALVVAALGVMLSSAWLIFSPIRTLRTHQHKHEHYPEQGHQAGAD
jgi:predicted MFS family arabinose efflux permease